MLKSHYPVTEDMVRNLILTLSANDVPYLVAPYEADAQLAYLSKADIIDFVLAEDSDLIVFGVKQILFKFRRSPQLEAVLFDANKLQGKFKDPDYLRKVCILSGCDYAKSIPGIGLKTAIKFVENIITAPDYSHDKFTDYLKHMPRVLKKRDMRIDDNYCMKFLTAVFCFNHYLVYYLFDRYTV